MSINTLKYKVKEDSTNGVDHYFVVDEDGFPVGGTMISMEVPIRTAWLSPMSFSRRKHAEDFARLMNFGKPY